MMVYYCLLCLDVVVVVIAVAVISCFVVLFVRSFVVFFFSLLLLHLMFSYSRIFTTFIFMEHEKKMYASPLGSYEH